jgi:quinoprotein relay system zinc metallohydrolase 2
MRITPALGLFLGLVLPGTGLAGADALGLREVAEGVFVGEGRHEETSPENLGHIANIGFIVGERSVAVIDTGGSPSIGERLREAVASTTGKPVSVVINTHMHPDHVLGNAAFPGIPVAGHRKLERAFAARADTFRRRLAETLGEEEAGRIVPLRVDMPVEDVLEIDLGGRVIELRAWPTAHTDNDLTVYDRRTGTLWLSDLLFLERVPALDGSILGWLDVMDELAAIPAARAVPGHGPVAADWPGALERPRRYLSAVAEGVREVLKAGGGIAEAVERVAPAERAQWLLFDEYHPRNVTAAFAELEWE